MKYVYLKPMFGIPVTWHMFRGTVPAVATAGLNKPNQLNICLRRTWPSSSPRWWVKGDIYHPFLRNFTYQHLLEKIWAYLDTFLAEVPPDFLFQVMGRNLGIPLGCVGVVRHLRPNSNMNVFHLHVKPNLYSCVTCRTSVTESPLRRRRAWRRAFPSAWNIF